MMPLPRDNYTMFNILSGARAQEKAEAEKK